VPLAAPRWVGAPFPRVLTIPGEEIVF